MAPLGLEKERKARYLERVPLGPGGKHAAPPPPGQLGDGFRLGGQKGFSGRAFLSVPLAALLARPGHLACTVGLR